MLLVSGVLVNVIEVAMGVGDRVETRRAEGSAASQTAHTEPCSSSGTILLDGLLGVLGTRGGEPTRGRPTFPGLLVPINAFEQE